MKVGLYVDDEVWAKFKELVFKKHKTLRRLSSEVEVLLRSLMMDEVITSGLGGIGVEVKETMPSSEVKRGRPPLRGPPAEEIVREMRGRRLAEALPGQ